MPDAVIHPGDTMYYGDPDRYLAVGRSALGCIEDAITASGRDRATVGTILDLPSGYGRVLRHLLEAFPRARITASDVDGEAVEFCASELGALPLIAPVEVGTLLTDATFDLIWCGSLLTHLSLEDCRRLLMMFSRHLSPGGLLVATTHGAYCYERMRAGGYAYGLPEDRVKALLVGYEREGYAFVGQGYGITLMRPDVLESLLPHNLRVVSYREHAWDSHQDVFAAAPCAKTRAALGAAATGEPPCYHHWATQSITSDLLTSPSRH